VTATITSYDGPMTALADRLVSRRITVAADEQGRPYLVRADSVVIDVDDVEEATARVAERGLEVLGPPLVARHPRLLGARIRPADRPTPDARGWGADVVNRLLDEFGSSDVVARPNHVYLPDGIGHLVPGARGEADANLHSLEALVSTARPATTPNRRRPLDLPDRRRPNVLVLDTGLRTASGRPEHPWLERCVIHEPWLDRSAGRFNDEDEPDDDGRGQLDAQAGHGTFISGIIHQRCPDAVVHHAGVLSSYGDGDDASVAAAIERVRHRFERSGVPLDLVVCAFGAYGDGPPPLADALATLPAGCVVVAAAGNDGTSRPFYPAALPGVVAVGAVDVDRRAPFTNFGPWVDACAQGVATVSTFFVDFDDEPPDQGRRFRGWASWSGTSFAAPVVGAAIAQCQYLHQSTAPAAWQAIGGDRRRLRIGDLGVFVPG